MRQPRAGRKWLIGAINATVECEDVILPFYGSHKKGVAVKRLFVSLTLAIVMTGCAHTNYRLVVHNGTVGRIDDTKVVLGNGEILKYGVMDSRINAGIWPVAGPLGNDVLVEWVDEQGNKKTAKATMSVGVQEDSVILLINPDDSVTVQTGRKLHGPRK
jgi:hypothetical protein